MVAELKYLADRVGHATQKCARTKNAFGPLQRKHTFVAEFMYTVNHTMKSAIRCAALVLLLHVAWGQTKTTEKTDAEIKQEMINESIAGYRGNCPCPYNTDRAGRRCGARSAYSRPSGATPICYAKDVTPKMVDDYRKRSRQ